MANETRRAAAVEVDLDGLVEPDGFPIDDPVWQVSWLSDLVADIPDEAVWPRLMTVPHPRAVGSLGREFEWWCLTHRRIRLRWWQRLVARRLLEVDEAGRLVWLVLILTLARQLGKSWLLWLILSWRLHQGPRFGEPQRLLHMSIQMAQVRDVMARELAHADARPDLYHTLDNNNDTWIEWLADGSKWVRIVKGSSRTGGAYGQSGVSVGVVDEAWSIPAAVVDEGLEPTIVEAVDPVLMLVSTAHRRATVLMLDRRAQALDALAVDELTLIVEWSTPRHYDLADPDGWRLASPHWSRQREQLIRGAVNRALAGLASDDPDEPDPIEAVRAQWLNQWPTKLVARGKGEALLDLSRWEACHTVGDVPLELWVAVADNFGRGAGVAAVAAVDDGLFEVDAWTCEGRAEALADARDTLAGHDVPGMLITEPALSSMAADATHAVPADVRFGLPLLRELGESGRLVHDRTPELDQQFGECRVRPVSGGLALVSPGRSDLVRAAALALRAAIVEAPMPAIHSAAAPGRVPRRAR